MAGEVREISRRLLVFVLFVAVFGIGAVLAAIELGEKDWTALATVVLLAFVTYFALHKAINWILLADVKPRWMPPETVGPIMAGQVWTYVPYNLRFGMRQDRFFVKILRTGEGIVHYSQIPGPQFNNLTKYESEFRQQFRLVPEIIAVQTDQ